MYYSKDLPQFESHFMASNLLKMLRALPLCPFLLMFSTGRFSVFLKDSLFCPSISPSFRGSLVIYHVEGRVISP
ncbi:unnamed protein product [Caenorhabditis sp. 36 PRJEB53466]|nr:unnamed protein product [Caenorhabditis sp. 36 PRJEB53466]